jgi:DNA-binding transcriptional ArsR family regulator
LTPAVNGGQDRGVGISIGVGALPVAGFLFSASPLAELGALLHALAEPEHHPALSGWLGAVTAGLDVSLAAELDRAGPLWRTSRADFLLPARPGSSLADELDAVDRLDDEAYVAAALDSGCVRVPVRAPGSPLTDARARRIVRDRARSRGPAYLTFVERTLAEPARIRAGVRNLLERCDAEFFADAWRRLEPDLSADARHKNDLLVRRGVADAMQAVSPAVAFDPVHERIIVDKLQDDATRAQPTGITFLPTVFGHPHIVVLHAFGARPVVQYPVAVANGQSAIETYDVVGRRLAALAHPVRLRLCRSLARAPLTTADLAERWRLSPPEVSRHLAVLVEAKLLTRERRGRYVHYRLDANVTARLGTDLLDALLR